MKANKLLNLFFVFAVTISLTACNPFKVTDPADPQFDPMKFEFEDYDPSGELQSVIEQVFPPGTTKEYVDNILIKKLGSTISSKPHVTNEGFIYKYQYKNLHTWFMQGISSGCSGYVIRMIYDNQSKVVSARMVRGPC